MDVCVNRPQWVKSIAQRRQMECSGSNTFKLQYGYCGVICIALWTTWLPETSIMRHVRSGGGYVIDVGTWCYWHNGFPSIDGNYMRVCKICWFEKCYKRCAASFYFVFTLLWKLLLARYKRSACCVIIYWLGFEPIFIYTRFRHLTSLTTNGWCLL